MHAEIQKLQSRKKYLNKECLELSLALQTIIFMTFTLLGVTTIVCSKKGGHDPFLW